MIHVIATIEIEAGRRAEFLAHFRELVPQVRAETGCVEYVPAVDTPTDIEAQHPLRDDVVMVIEKWRDRQALRAHLAAPHMAEYRDKVKDLVSRVTIHVLEPAG
jgi:quinol monooxygenase YgiN